MAFGARARARGPSGAAEALARPATGARAPNAKPCRDSTARPAHERDERADARTRMLQPLVATQPQAATQQQTTRARAHTHTRGGTQRATSSTRVCLCAPLGSHTCALLRLLLLPLGWLIKTFRKCSSNRKATLAAGWCVCVCVSVCVRARAPANVHTHAGARRRRLVWRHLLPYC